jgi:hypothetical protein
MGEDYAPGKMAADMKENISLTKNKGSEHTLGRMEKDILVNGRMEKEMEMEK